ncbi:MAG: MBL fold metallo-hydrolase [Candidatus Krumholzibacteriales bacterium]
MIIEIPGARGEVESSVPWHSGQSGVLIDGSLLLDLGEPEYLKRGPDAALITHLHPDHPFFLRDGEEPDADIPLYAPEERSGPVEVEKLPEVIDTGRYTVRAIPTHHSLKVESAALLVEDGSHRICYTGDMIWINREYHEYLEGLDLVITDGSFIRKKGMIRRDRSTGRIYGHAGIPDLIRLFSGFTSRIRFVHFGNWFYRDISDAREKIRELGKENGVDSRAVRDGQEINLDNKKDGSG